MPQLSWKSKTFLISVVAPIALVLATYGGFAVTPLLMVPVIFYLPGHVLLRRFRKAAPIDLEHVLFAFGLSVAIAIAFGFLLHVFGLVRPIAWAIFFTAIAAIGLPELGISQKLASDQLALKNPMRDALMLSIASALVMCVFVLNYRAAAVHSEFWFTEFWMTYGRAPNVLTIGIRNSEGAPATYDVEVMTEGQIIRHWPGVSLQPGETWTVPLNTTVKSDQIERVEAWLFKNGDHRSVYRRVWTDVGRAPNGEL